LLERKRELYRAKPPGWAVDPDRAGGASVSGPTRRHGRSRRGDHAMFHVEHAERPLVDLGQHRSPLGTGDEYLGTTAMQTLEQPMLMLAVKLGGQIVQQ